MLLGVCYEECAMHGCACVLSMYSAAAAYSTACTSGSASHHVLCKAAWHEALATFLCGSRPPENAVLYEQGQFGTACQQHAAPAQQVLNHSVKPYLLALPVSSRCGYVL
jgi:hypothetical protein